MKKIWIEFDSEGYERDKGILIIKTRHGETFLAIQFNAGRDDYLRLDRVMTLNPKIWIE